MVEKSHRLNRIVPREKRRFDGNSWSEKSKIYAIKVGEGELPQLYKYQLIRQKSPVENVKKWIEKCTWKPPCILIAFSVIQVREKLQIFCLIKMFFFRSQLCVHLAEPSDLAYQTFAFSPEKTSELWRFFTYSFLHANSAHLLINVILQLVIACPLETELGSFRVALVYLGGILSGSVAASVSSDSSLMVGASSGIYALLTSHISQIYLVRFFCCFHSIFLIFCSRISMKFPIAHIE